MVKADEHHSAIHTLIELLNLEIQTRHSKVLTAKPCQTSPETEIQPIRRIKSHFRHSLTRRTIVYIPALLLQHMLVRIGLMYPQADTHLRKHQFDYLQGGSHCRHRRLLTVNYHHLRTWCTLTIHGLDDCNCRIAFSKWPNLWTLQCPNVTCPLHCRPGVLCRLFLHPKTTRSLL